MINGLPEKLQALRTKHGLSQKQLSTKLKLSPSIISAYETGERTPSTEVLLSLSYIYNCSTDYLLGRCSFDSITVDVNGLTEEQIWAINALIDSMRKK